MLDSVRRGIGRAKQRGSFLPQRIMGKHVSEGSRVDQLERDRFTPWDHGETCLERCTSRPINERGTSTCKTSKKHWFSRCFRKSVDESDRL